MDTFGQLLVKIRLLLISTSGHTDFKHIFAILQLRTTSIKISYDIVFFVFHGKQFINVKRERIFIILLFRKQFAVLNVGGAGIV